MMKTKILGLYLLIFIGIMTCNFAKAQSVSTDSIEIELQKIKDRNAILKIKDSIRGIIINQEFSNIVNPQSKELEKYKTELLKIKSEDSLRLAKLKESVEKLRKKVKPYSVEFFHKPLFNIYSGLGPFSAKERATTAQNEIKKLYENKVYFEDSLKLAPAREYINIVYQGHVITSVAQEDAFWENMPQDTLALHYRNIINTSIQENRQSHTFENTTIRWLLAIAIIFGFFLMIFLTRRFFRFVIRKIITKKEKEAKGITIKNYQFLSPRKFKTIAVKILKWTHLLLFIIFSGIAISLIFSIFPSTEHYANLLIQWISVPLKDLGHSLYNYIPNFLRIIVILIVGKYLDKALRYFSIEIERNILKIKGFHREWAKPTYQLLRLCLIAFIIIMIFPYLPGSDTSAFRGVSVFFGVLLSLGSSSAIANTIAGFIITYMRPFQIGDWIKINDVTGEVIEKTALVTRLRTINNEDVTIPNSMILTNKTTNYSSAKDDQSLIIPINININYDVDFEIVNELLMKAALTTTDVEKIPRPFVFKNKIEDTVINYQLNAFTKKPERMYYITSDLNENILKTFKEANINLLSPRFFPKPKN